MFIPTPLTATARRSHQNLVLYPAARPAATPMVTNLKQLFTRSQFTCRHLPRWINFEFLAINLNDSSICRFSTRRWLEVLFASILAIMRRLVKLCIEWQKSRRWLRRQKFINSATGVLIRALNLSTEVKRGFSDWSSFPIGELCSVFTIISLIHFQAFHFQNRFIVSLSSVSFSKSFHCFTFERFIFKCFIFTTISLFHFLVFHFQNRFIVSLSSVSFTIFIHFQRLHSIGVRSMAGHLWKKWCWFTNCR